jgi:hypothetical protein
LLKQSITDELSVRFVSLLSKSSDPVVGMQMPGCYEVFANEAHQRSFRFGLPPFDWMEVVGFKPRTNSQSGSSLCYCSKIGSIFALDGARHCPFDSALQRVPPHSIWTWGTRLGFFNFLEQQNQRSYDIFVAHVCYAKGQELAIAHLAQLNGLKLLVRSTMTNVLVTSVAYSEELLIPEITIPCSEDPLYMRFYKVLGDAIQELESGAEVGQVEGSLISEINRFKLTYSTSIIGHIRYLFSSDEPISALRSFQARSCDSLVIDVLGDGLLDMLNEDRRFRDSIPMPVNLMPGMSTETRKPIDVSEFEMNLEAFRKEQSNLMKKRPNAYVAVCKGKVIDFDKNYEALAGRVWAANPGNHVLIQPVDPTAVSFRSGQMAD